jgi:hypothetical protein
VSEPPTETSLITVCYAKCWPCTFAEDDSQHLPEPHTWMDDEDFDHAKATGQLPADATWAQMAELRPCGCWCVPKPKPAAEVVDGTGEAP